MLTRWRSKSDKRTSTLAAQLVELRKPLVIAILSILLASSAGFFAADFVVAALREPVQAAEEASGRQAPLNFSVVTQAFDLNIQIALTIGILASSPVWLYQIGAFRVPGSAHKEKQYAIAYLGAAVPCLLTGCTVGWLVVPHVVLLMLGFADAAGSSFLDANYYYDFVLKLLLATGIAFFLLVFRVLRNFVGVLLGVDHQGTASRDIPALPVHGDCDAGGKCPVHVPACHPNCSPVGRGRWCCRTSRPTVAKGSARARWCDLAMNDNHLVGQGAGDPAAFSAPKEA